jgi:hypothetical protein
MANGKQLATVDEHFHHSVYVILLDSSVLRHPSILRLNPNRQLTKPCVYVGMTGLPVEQRFENHKKGQKSAWVVKKYGLRLMPELYGFLNPMPFESSSSNGKGFGRGSTSGWLYRHRWYIGDDSPPGRGEQHWKQSCSSSLPFMHAFFQAFGGQPKFGPWKHCGCSIRLALSVGNGS